jgi:hypothetical protein
MNRLTPVTQQFPAKILVLDEKFGNDAPQKTVFLS